MVVFLIGGVTYAMIEIMWRGNTHWTMVLLGGLCFLTLYKLFGYMSNYSLMEKNNFDVMNNQVHDKINQDDKKRNIYNAFSDYIICLEKTLNTETNPYKMSLIKDEISKLRIEQQKYYVPSILERAVYNENKDNNSLEKSSFSLVKQIKAKFNYKNRESGNNNE